MELATAMSLNEKSTMRPTYPEESQRHEARTCDTMRCKIAKCGQLFQYQITRTQISRHCWTAHRSSFSKYYRASLGTVVLSHQSLRKYLLQKPSNQVDNELSYF